MTRMLSVLPPSPEDREGPPTMKNPWLILAAILVVVAAATGTKRDRYIMRLLNSTYYPGGYSVLSAPLHPEETIFNRTDVLNVPALESGKLLEPRSDPRTKREAGALRRGRMRAGPRPTCRGCYSGLMIVAPPGQDSKNASWDQSSRSESEGGSSEGD